jgi:hypothetical protein
MDPQRFEQVKHSLNIFMGKRVREVYGPSQDEIDELRRCRSPRYLYLKMRKSRNDRAMSYLRSYDVLTDFWRLVLRRKENGPYESQYVKRVGRACDEFRKKFGQYQDSKAVRAKLSSMVLYDIASMWEDYRMPIKNYEGPEIRYW